jgi:hypothetical protein
LPTCAPIDCFGTWPTRATPLSNSADAVTFGNLAVKMHGEFRRLALAVKDYRAPAVNRLVVVAEDDEQPAEKKKGPA